MKIRRIEPGRYEIPAPNGPIVIEQGSAGRNPYGQARKNPRAGMPWYVCDGRNLVAEVWSYAEAKAAAARYIAAQEA